MPRLPYAMDRLQSRMRWIDVFVSPSNSFTKNRSRRPNTFQSILRMSSPGRYGLYSAKLTLKPRWGERWSPATNPSTTVRATSSRLEIRVSTAGSMKRVGCGVEGLMPAMTDSQPGSRHRNGFEQPSDYFIPGHPLRLRVKVGENPVSHHGVGQLLYVLDRGI